MLKYTKNIFLLLFSFFLAPVVFANDSLGVKLTSHAERLSGKEAVLYIKAFIEPGIKLFSITPKKSDDAASSIQMDSSLKQYLNGSIIEKGNIQTENDNILGYEVNYYTDSIVWEQKLNIDTPDSILLKASVSLFVKKGEEYLPADETIRAWLPSATLKENTNNTVAATNHVVGKSLWWIFLTAFGGGLLALLTPCVYSMIPITVSFFTKRSKSVAEGKKNALLYAASIVLIFTILGFLITVVFGPAALNQLATNWIANLLFFAIFLLFGISFLGAFEINLPSSWSNKVDSKAGMGSFAGIFFMALTLVLVSFSCTGPIIGNLLVLAAQGNYYGPLIGMFGFSLALALPFALFAFFPSKLSVLGKAGGWLNSIKVTLGFLELALALKFLSNADLAMGWRLLDREIYLSLWIVIFLLLGIYLLGKLKFKHDDDLPQNDFGHPYLKVMRLFFAMASLSFSVYMVPGLWGAPLNGIAAFLPPMGTQAYITGAALPAHSENTSSTTNVFPAPVKYYERMHIYEPEVVKKYGLVTYFDLKEAQDVANKLHKPLMLDFTGINCVNCRKMEAEVWSDSKVMKILKEDFVIASLFVDVHNVKIPDNEQYRSATQNKQIETLGELNTDIQVSQFGANAQPFYFFLDNKGNRLIKEGYGYDPNVEKFIALLEKVKADYGQRIP
ncbi:MAG: thioredoxin family protein [Chitinophagaceae bacterium]|nr:thioredoxin family protein [Chitinophagaceae bacterium]